MAYSFREMTAKIPWERHVQSFAPGSLFQSWSWGDVLRAAGGEVSRIGMFEGNLLVGTMQLVRVRARRGNFLHVRHGPVFSRQSKAVWAAATAYLSSLAVRDGLWFIRVSPQVEDSEQNRGILRKLRYRPAPIHAMDAEYCWVLDLTPSEEEILSAMRKTTRYEIRQAAKAGVTVRSSSDPADFAAFLALYGKTADRHGFVPHTGIREEFEHFVRSGQGMMLLGYAGAELRSGAIVLFNGSEAIYHHGASVPSREPVSSSIQWEAIREAKRRGCRRYNFWGIAPEGKKHHPWRGITVFKKGFGGHEQRYLHAHDLPVSPMYGLTWLVESARRLSRGY